MPHERAGIREVEDREFVPLGRHGQPAERAGVSDVGFERVEIAHGGRAGDGGMEHDRLELVPGHGQEIEPLPGRALRAGEGVARGGETPVPVREQRFHRGEERGARIGNIQGRGGSRQLENGAVLERAQRTGARPLRREGDQTHRGVRGCLGEPVPARSPRRGP